MRILILTQEFPPFRGGVGTYCVEIAKAAIADGHTVEILAPSYGNAENNEDQTYPFKVHRFAGGVFSTAHLPRLLIALLKVKPWTFDCIHAADWPFVMVLPWLKWLVRKPIVVTMHGTDVLLLATSRVAGRLFGRDYLRAADLVVTNSRFTANLVLKHHPYLATPQRLEVTLLGVDPFWFEAPADVAGTLSRHGIPDGRKILLTVARLDVRKGHRLVLQALAQLPTEAKSKIAYAIVGKALDESYLNELKTLAAQSGVPVVFTGAVSTEDVRNFYSAAWLFCMLAEPIPDKVEGFGLAYLEAAAQSLPSLAAPLGGVPEVVRDRETGILFQSRSPDDLATAIAMLLEVDINIAAYGHAARDWARTFSWQRCARLTYDRDRLLESSPSLAAARPHPVTGDQKR